MTIIELTERYSGDSRAQRLLRKYTAAHDALLKLALQLREERYPVFAEATDMLGKLLLGQAKRNCEAAVLPVTGEVVGRTGSGRS